MAINHRQFIRLTSKLIYFLAHQLLPMNTPYRIFTEVTDYCIWYLIECTDYNLKIHVLVDFPQTVPSCGFILSDNIYFEHLLWIDYSALFEVFDNKK